MLGVIGDDDKPKLGSILIRRAQPVAARAASMDGSEDGAGTGMPKDLPEGFDAKEGLMSASRGMMSALSSGNEKAFARSLKAFLELHPGIEIDDPEELGSIFG